MSSRIQFDSWKPETMKAMMEMMKRWDHEFERDRHIDVA